MRQDWSRLQFLAHYENAPISSSFTAHYTPKHVAHVGDSQPSCQFQFAVLEVMMSSKIWIVLTPRLYTLLHSDGK